MCFRIVRPLDYFIWRQGCCVIIRLISKLRKTESENEGRRPDKIKLDCTFPMAASGR